MAYKWSIDSHHNILKHLLPNKRSKEHIESKSKCQEHSNSHHLHTDKEKGWNFAQHPELKQQKKAQIYILGTETTKGTQKKKPGVDDKEAAIRASSFPVQMLQPQKKAPKKKRNREGRTKKKERMCLRQENKNIGCFFFPAGFAYTYFLTLSLIFRGK